LLIWEKGWPGIGDVVTNWGAGHEFIYYLKRGSRRMPYRRSGVLHFDKVLPGKNVHPSEKPTALLKCLIEMSTSPGGWIIDPYAGSASTLVAARESGRNAVGIEMDDAYYETGMRRLSAHSLFEV
jgi:DNA modification methylase